MLDLSCFLAGFIKLITPVLLLMFWKKKTYSRITPALAAWIICLPIFIVGAAIRSGFSTDDYISFSIQQGLIFGILEETTKFLMMRYVLTSYDNRKDAVTYGIGHGAYESFGGGLACFGLIGTGNADPSILGFNLYTEIEGILFVISLTVLIFYGIYMNKSIIMLPVAIFLHALSSTVTGIFIEPAAIGINLVLLAGQCYAALRCWKAMQTSDNYYY